MQTVFTSGGPNPFKGAKTQHLIQADQSESGKRLFTVTYGLQQKKGLTYAQACTEIGAAILHDACCQGNASNEGV
jgi:hypothetical protein